MLAELWPSLGVKLGAKDGELSVRHGVDGAALPHGNALKACRDASEDLCVIGEDGVGPRWPEPVGGELGVDEALQFTAVVGPPADLTACGITNQLVAKANGEQGALNLALEKGHEPTAQAMNPRQIVVN